MYKKMDGVTYLTWQEIKENKNFGWSRDSLYRWAREGKLKPYKFYGDNKSYWSMAELNALRKPVANESLVMAGD